MAKKVQVYSAAFHLMESNPDAMKEALLYAIMKNRSIPEVLIKYVSGSMAVKVPSARRYAEDHYTLGLPNDGFSTSGAKDDLDIADIVTQDLSLPYGCLVLYNYYLPTTDLVLATPYLLDTRGYSAVTGEITVLPDDWILPKERGGLPVLVTCYIESTEVDTYANTLQLNYFAKAQYITYTGGDSGLDIEFHSIPENEYQATYFEIIPLFDGYIPGSHYYIVGYRALDIDGNAEEATQWWYYNVRANKYPDLLPNVLEEETLVNSFPVVPIRHENMFIGEEYVNEAEETVIYEPDIYETGSKLLKKLGMDMDYLQEKMGENEEGLEDIDNAYVMFGIDLQTDDYASLCYLTEFFAYLEEASGRSIWDRIGEIASGNDPGYQENIYSSGLIPLDQAYSTSSTSREIPESGGVGPYTVGTTIVNPDAALGIEEHDLRTDIHYKHITTVYIDGQIGEGDDLGKVGVATKQIEYFPILKTVERDYDGEIVDTVIMVQGEWDTKLTLRQQMAPNVYRKVTVFSPVHTNHVYKKKVVITTPKDVLEDPDEHNFIIPLHWTTMQRLNIHEKAIVYADSLVMVMNSYIVTKLKWYETSVFKAIAMFVIIIVVAWTGQGWLLELGAAIGTGLMATAAFLLPYAVASIIISYLVKIVVDLLGPRLAFIAAVIAVVAAVVMKRFDLMIKYLPPAQSLLSIGLEGMKQAGQTIQDMAASVIDDMNDFLIESEEQLAELQAVKDELFGSESLLPPSLLIDTIKRPTPDTKTAPENFYDAIHIGNVGTLSLDVVEQFVNISLLLPQVEGYA